MSAIEWAASASMADEPETSAGDELGHRDRRVGRQRDEHACGARRCGPPPRGHQREPLRAAAASATSAAMRRLVSSASGCHWTPSAKRRSGASKASGSSSMRRPAGDLEALADAVDALVVVGLRAVGDLARGARGQRAVGQAHVVVGAVEGAGVAAVLVVAVALGQVLQQRAAARRRS